MSDDQPSALSRFLILMAALAIGLVRPFLDSHPVSHAGSYEALAHLFVGGLFGAWLATRERIYLSIVLWLSALELICFLLKK